jgi:hypothetical protein
MGSSAAWAGLLRLSRAVDAALVGLRGGGSESIQGEQGSTLISTWRCVASALGNAPAELVLARGMTGQRR